MNVMDAAPMGEFSAPYDLLAAILEDGTREWRGEMDPALGPDAMVWQPAPGMHSIGAVILHIAWVELAWMEGYVRGQTLDAADRALMLARETNVDEWQWPVPPAQPLAWYFEIHDRVRARVLAGLKEWGPADSVIDPEDDPRTPRWVFGHVIQHESYHGGQAVLLSRLWELSHGAS